ncbi:MAG: DUF1573 domain-containing protein [Phycisphaerales bacterium]|jgi:hypothetical protein|nr:DUF1573 domain-containing protein [Phycisphaerales bacterium]
MVEDMSPKDRSRRGQLLGLGILAVAALLAVVFWPRATLSGERSHDFGRVAFENPPHRVEHVFELVNVGSEPVQVTRFKSTCGCTQASGAGRVAHPGETLRVPVTLRLNRSGPKDGTVTVSLTDGTSVDLEVKAIAAPGNTFRVGPPVVQLRAPLGTGESNLLIEADTMPPDPAIEGPDGLAIDFKGWEEFELGDPSVGKMAGWRGRIHFKAEDGGPDAGQRVVLRMPDGQTASILVNPRAIPVGESGQPAIEGPPAPE